MSTAALLSAIGLTAACGESPERGDAGGKPRTAASAAADKSERSEPVTAVELKAALLTAEQAVGFEITGSRSRDGAAPESSFDAEETVSPEVCRHVKEATSGDGEEASAASSIMYPAGTSISPRSTSLMSYPEEAARARMTQLREAVGTCGRFRFSNKFGKSSVTSEVLKVPGLGEDALRYRTLSRLGSSGFAWTLVTVVRVGGVIATMQVMVPTGPMTPEKLATFKPEPGPEEAVTAALIKNVTEAGST